VTQPSRRRFLRCSTLAAGALAFPRTSLAAAPSWVHKLSLGDDFSDLRFLAPLLAKARIVQLGENGHGTAEATTVRSRIARFLYEELDFRVLAFESSLFLCHLAETRARDVEAQRTLTSSLVGVWHTHEMLPLFEAVRRSYGTARPLRLAGFDVQPIGSNKKLRPTFFADMLSAVDAEYARAAAALDTAFLAEYDKGSAARRAYLRSEGARLAGEFERLAAFIKARLADIQRHAGATAPLVARQEALSMAAYVRFQAAADMRQYAEIRDEGMFENLRFLAEELYPDSKIIVWGHNYHLRHDNAAIPATPTVFPGVQARSMGTWTRKHFGDRVFTVGQYERAGIAFDNSRQPYDIAAPGKDTLEGRLSELADGRAFVNLGAGAKTEEGEWINRPVVGRYNGQHPETITPAAQYDALLMLPTVSPPRFLY
jgi:erythromycin esterase